MIWITLGLIALYGVVLLLIEGAKIATACLDAFGAVCLAGYEFAATLIGKLAARGTPTLESSSVIVNRALPRPSNDPVVQRLTDYAKQNPAWPRWEQAWPKIITTGLGDTAVFVEDIEALTSTATNCSPPYYVLDKVASFPSAPAPAKGYEPLANDFPLPTLKLPPSRLPFNLLSNAIKHAYRDTIKEHERQLRQHRQLVEAVTEVNAARERAYQDAQAKHRDALTKHHAAQAAFEANRDNYLAPLKNVKIALSENRLRDAALQHFDLVLQLLSLPPFIPRAWSLAYDEEVKTLLVEHRFPAVANAHIMRKVQNKRSVSTRSVPQRHRTEAIARLQSSLALVLAGAIADSDTFQLVEGIAINGWVDYFDRGTGRLARSYCCNVVCTKHAVQSISLATADPTAAFNRLGGAAALESYEIAPVRPNLKLSMTDDRFVEARPTLEGLAEMQNLAAMPWEDFEHLVRELFERRFASGGSEVRITRASRDHGVDAVIFDPDPIRGGKIVVQAKRYTIPVDVSAVRDLYGTVMNEGANTGILVTTSTFGPDAYAFANGKQLKLLNGSELLGLLQEVGFKFRIDIAEARRALRQDA